MPLNEERKKTAILFPSQAFLDVSFLVDTPKGEDGINPSS
jgi:hypothetical protein